MKIIKTIIAAKTDLNEDGRGNCTIVILIPILITDKSNMNANNIVNTNSNIVKIQSGILRRLLNCCIL